MHDLDPKMIGFQHPIPSPSYELRWPWPIPLPLEERPTQVCGSYKEPIARSWSAPIPILALETGYTSVRPMHKVDQLRRADQPSLMIAFGMSTGFSMIKR